MAEIFVGEVAVGVVPDLRGFNDKLRAGLVPSANAIGRDIGKEISKGIADNINIGKAITDSVTKNIATIKVAGAKAGDTFGKEFKRALGLQMKDLPKVKLDFDINKASLTRVKAAIKDAIGTVKLDVEINNASLARARAVIKDSLGSVKVDVDVNKSSITRVKKAFSDALKDIIPGGSGGGSSGGGVGALIPGGAGGAGGTASSGFGAALRGNQLAGIAQAFSAAPLPVQAGAVAAALAALPLIAQAAAGSVVAALGGAFVGIGIYAAAQTKKVQDAWKTFTDKAKIGVQQVGQAFAPVVVHIIGTLTGVADKLGHVFIGVLKVIGPPFQAFADAIIKGLASPHVISAMDAIGKAFGGILNALTPDIPGIINSMADGVTRIANAVAKNPKAFADFINFLFQIVIAVLNGIAYLTLFADYIEAHFTPAMHRIAVVFDGVRHEVAHIWGLIYDDTIGVVIRIGHNVETQFDSMRHEVSVIFDGMRHDINHIMDLIYNDTIGVAIRIGHNVETQFDSLRHSTANNFNTMRHETAVIFDGIRHDIAHTWDQIYSNTIGAVIRVWQKTNTEFASNRHTVAGVMDGVRHDIANAWNDIYGATIGSLIRIGHNVETQFNSLRHSIAGIYDGIRHDISHYWDLIYSDTIGRVIRMYKWLNDQTNNLRHQIAGIYDNIRHDISHYWDLIYSDTIGRVVRQGHDVAVQFDNQRHQISSIFAGIQHDIASAWNLIWAVSIGQSIQGWNNLAGVFSRGWNAIWAHTMTPMINFFTNSVPHAFQVSVDAIGRFWSALYNDIRNPVVNVVDHVLNALIDAFNAITKYIGVGAHINPVHPQGLAAGGRITSGTGPTADDVLVRVSRNETVVSAADSAVLAPVFSDMGIRGYANGGKVGQAPPGRGGVLGAGAPTGPAFGPLQGAVVKAIDAGKMAAAFATQNVAAFTNAFAGLLGKAPGAGSGVLSQILIKIPQTIAKAFVDWIMQKSAAAAAATGSGSDIANYAASFVGKIPYVWGGTAIPGGADCSGFVQGIYRHFGINAPRTSEEQGAWVKRGSPTSGGLALYHSPAGGPDPGHVAIVKTANVVISQGGGMGPQLMALHGMPLLWTGTPPGGFGGAVGAGSPGVGNLIANATAIGTYLLAHGANKIAAAGIMGNMLQESGGNWNAPGGGLIQIISAPQPGSLAQSLQQTIDYINQNGGMGPINAAQNVAMATEVFMNQYERPAPATENLGRRLAGAQAAYGAGYDNGGWLPPGASIAYNLTGRPERILSHEQLAAAHSRGGDGTSYHAHFDGLTGAAIEGHVRTAFQAMSMTSGRLNRQGRRS